MSSGPYRVLFDINVVLDVVLAREPHVVASATALDRAVHGEVEGWISAHAITTLFYLTARPLGADRARLILVRLLQHLRIARVDDAVVRAALASPVVDFEDAVTVEAAVASGAKLVVTRNSRDFAEGPLPSVHPEAFVVRPG